MTYIDFKNKYNGKVVDYDGAFGGQCWDLAQQYFTEALGIPASVLGGCGLVSNMLVEPKLSQLLKYFDEVPTNAMNQGDVCIWPYGHIAIYDNYENGSLLFLTQNDGGAENPSGATHVGVINNNAFRAFRFKDGIKVKGHIESIGWSNWQNNVAGTTGQGKRLEAIQIDSNRPIKAKAHIQDKGWVDFGTITKDTIIGTVGQSRRLEAIKLDGDIEYKVHIEGIGWSNFVKGGTELGTVGLGLRIEAIIIKI